MKKLISKLFNSETVIEKITEDRGLFEVKGHLKHSLFQSIRLYKESEPKNWYCYSTCEYVGDIYDLSDEQLLRGRV